jgi:tight adherence protein C
MCKNVFFRRLPIYITLFIFAFLSADAWAQSRKKVEIVYEDDLKILNERELLKKYQDSCNHESQAANCLQAAKLYKKGVLGPSSFAQKPISKEEAKKRAGEYMKKACSLGEEEACDQIKKKPLYKGSDLLFWSAILLVGLAVLLIARQIFEDEDQFRAQEKLQESGEGDKENKRNEHGIVLKYSRPFFSRYVTPVVQNMKHKNKIKERYKRKLASAGLTDIMSPEDFYAFKLFLIIAFPILFIGLREYLEESWPLTLVPITGAVGFIYPDIWIKGKITQRQQDITRAMPFAVDMLALSVEAGLDFIAAITKVVEKAKPSALVDEFEILLKDIRIGASRAESLRNLAWRTDMITMSSFCATLIAADSVGASIGPILKALSAEIRQKRSSEVEKAGATAATKILFPMLFLIVPAVFIIVGAPIALEMMNGGR